MPETVVEHLVNEYTEKYTKLKEQLDGPMIELAEVEEILSRLEHEAVKATTPRRPRKKIDSDTILTVLGGANEPLRPGEIQKRAKIRVAPNTMSQKLKAMLRAGQIIREGKGAGSRYTLA